MKLLSLTPAFRPVITRPSQGKPFSTAFLMPQFCFRSSRSGRIFPTMDATNRDAVEELLRTYGETGGINYLAAAATLPSRLAIEAACAELMSLMFPGFRSQALVSSEDLADAFRAASSLDGYRRSLRRGPSCKKL